MAPSDRPHVASNGAEPPTEFLLEEHVGFLLRKAHQRHAAIFLETASKAGLTPTQFAALCKTAEVGKVTQNYLGRMVAMDPATIQGVVRRLTARGLLVRTHDPMDRRTAVLAATEAGLELIGDAVASARRAHDTALAPLSDDERQVFLTLLQKMV